MLAAACPPGPERDRLRRGLATLGEAESLRSAEVEQTAPHAAAGHTTAPLELHSPGIRRLTRLKQRLRREVAAPGPVAESVRRRIASQAIAAAAMEARNERDLENHLLRLKDAGVPPGAEHVLRSLGQELGNWALPKGLADATELGPAQEVRAMKQIVALPEDPAEVARRYRHLVAAATEQFNEGNLGRAVQMFDLAQKLASEKKIEAGFLEPIQAKDQASTPAWAMTWSAPIACRSCSR